MIFMNLYLRARNSSEKYKNLLSFCGVSTVWDNEVTLNLKVHSTSMRKKNFYGKKPQITHISHTFSLFLKITSFYLYAFVLIFN